MVSGYYGECELKSETLERENLALIWTMWPENVYSENPKSVQSGARELEEWPKDCKFGEEEFECESEVR